MVMLTVLAVALLALFAPKTCLWIDPAWINYLLGVVMFGMGLSLKLSDFALIVKRPKDVLIGCSAQFIVMPALAYALGKAFHLEPALLAGVALVGACPGGTASNVITFLSRGDLALSVAITSLSTALAPIATPAITYLLLRETVAVDYFVMFKIIAVVVVLPVVLGFVANRYFATITAKISKVTPAISVAAICIIIAAVVSRNAEAVRTSSAVVFVVVILHNLLGYFFGFSIARIFKMPAEKIKAVTIEIGMQNSGLASGLATSVFENAPLAAAPGAIFSVWHNISGAILAEIFKRWNAPSSTAWATKNDD